MYNRFAKIYDSFMDNVPYDEWCNQTVSSLSKYGINSGIVADLGCGTGNMTERLASKGFDMIGIDISDEMLQEALEKKYISGHDILYLCQDIREFELYGTCAAIISRCDSLNYVTDYNDLVKTFKLVNNYLDPEGVFVFDMKTEYMYRELLADNTFSRSNDDATYIWENHYFDEDKINEYMLTMFIRNGEAFEKSVEIHDQRAYSIDELKSAAAEAGLIWESISDADTDGDVDDQTSRYLVILKESGKKR